MMKTMKAKMQNNIWILGLIVLISSYTNVVSANCNSMLMGDVTETLWEEAYEAEKNMYALRLSTEALMTEFFKIQDLNLTDEKGEPLTLEGFNIEKFKELILSLSHSVSDFHHFGIPMPVPSRPTDISAIDSRNLIGQISSQLSEEAIMNLAQAEAGKALAQIESHIPTVFSQLREAIQDSYVPLHSEFREQGLDHEKLYTMKATYIEINNYSARLLHSVKHGKKGIGFL